MGKPCCLDVCQLQGSPGETCPDLQINKRFPPPANITCNQHPTSSRRFHLELINVTQIGLVCEVFLLSETWSSPPAWPPGGTLLSLEVGRQSPADRTLTWRGARHLGHPPGEEGRPEVFFQRWKVCMRLGLPGGLGLSGVDTWSDSAKDHSLTRLYLSCNS